MQKYRYIVFEPVDSVREQLKLILQSPVYDIAINLAGRISNDNTFRIYPKFSMGIEVFGIVQNTSIITGKIYAEDGQTNIMVEVRPNHAVLLAFYLTLLIFLPRLVGLFTSGTESDLILVAALFIFLIIIRSLIHFSIGRLKNRFERNMSVHPEE
ncbi:MAG: hypothetical protein ACXWC7_02670 [Chitinophagaceae bacterium]